MRSTPLDDAEREPDFERIAREARPWTCPDCGTEYDVGRGIPLGTEACEECGYGTRARPRPDDGGGGGASAPGRAS